MRWRSSFRFPIETWPASAASVILVRLKAIFFLVVTAFFLPGAIILLGGLFRLFRVSGVVGQVFIYGFIGSSLLNAAVGLLALLARQLDRRRARTAGLISIVPPTTPTHP